MAVIIVAVVVAVIVGRVVVDGSGVAWGIDGMWVCAHRLVSNLLGHSGRPSGSTSAFEGRGVEGSQEPM